MPPKKSKKKDMKGKKKTAADGEVTKDELWNQVIALGEELGQMQKQKNHFRHERDNCMVSWDISKRRLEEKRAQLRETLRLKQETEKHYHDKIKELHQQLKHVQLEHHNAISELRIKDAASQCQRLNENSERELALQKQRLAMQAALLEKKRNTEKCIIDLTLKQKDIMDLRYQYDNSLSQIQRSHMQKTQHMMSEHTKRLNVSFAQARDEIIDKVCTSSQEVKRQWRALKNRTKQMDKKMGIGEATTPPEVETPNGSDTSESEEEEVIPSRVDSP